MKYPIKKSYTVAAASLTGHASNVTGAAWTITTAESGDNMGHLVTVRNDSSTDHSAKTIILTGYDANGKAISETISAPGTSATVTGTKYFWVLATATPSATIGADTFDIGWSAAAATPFEKMETKRQKFDATVTVVKGGTVNYNVQHTQEIEADATVFAYNLEEAGHTESADFVYTSAVAGIRVVVNSHTSGTLTITTNQGEI